MRIHGGEKRDMALDFSVSVNPFGMPAACRRAIADSIQECLRYPETECTALKEKLSKINGGAGVILGSGASELIYAICHYMSRRYKEYTALTIAPTFMEYEYAIKASGGWVRVCSAQENRDFDVTEEICAYVDTDVKVVFICNPNNPTGQLIDRSIIESLAEKCAVADTVLVVDECFLRFSEEYAEYSMTSCLDKYPGVIVLDDFAKFYGMPGLRLGYGLCRDGELLDAIRLQIQPWNITAPAMEAGIKALEDPAFERETVRLISRERKDLIAGLKECGYRIVGEPAANFIMFAGPEGLRGKLNERGIDLRDCSDMMKYHDTRDRYYRTAVDTHEKNERLIRALKEIG